MKLTTCTTALAILIATVLSPDLAMAASKKKFRSRSEIPAAERAMIFKWAMAQCRKKYGPYIHHVEIEYTYGRFTCYIG